MKNIVDFISKNSDKIEIFKNLECNEDEIKILQFLTKNFIDGTPSMSTYNLLSTIFETKDYKFLDHLSDIRTLLDLGLVDISMNMFKNDTYGKKTSDLGLLHTEIEPSEYFLQILEAGQIKQGLPQISPYNDHLEYLKDQFFRIDLYKKRTDTNAATSIEKIDKKIIKLENIINERLKITKFALIVEQIFKANSLNQKEQIIFLALLKEEYSSEFDSLRDMNTLVALISKSELERIKNRSMLEDGANLIANGLIDYEENIAFGGILRNFYINEEILQSIMHPQNRKKSKKTLIENIVKESEIFELIEPTTDINDVILNPKTKELLEIILKQVDKKVINRLANWGVKNRRLIDAKIIFYGPAGTGKTMSALSLAKSLKKPVVNFDCSKILSKYVGESEQNVRKVFDVYNDIRAKTKIEPVLLLNEADQFLSARIQGGSSSDKMHNQMQNIFLEQIEKFEGVLIATTNLLGNIDTAFSRRFDYKIEFKRPNFDERLAIWRKILPENADFSSDFDVSELARYELSGAQIMLVLKNTALKVAIKDDGIFSLDDFRSEINRELSSKFDEDVKVGLL